MRYVFATNNKHKLEEVRQILGSRVEVLSLNDIGCDVDIPETGKTLEENALMKARFVWEKYHLNVFADDTGLEVDALNGAPGIYSARYASLENVGSNTPASHDSEANMTRLLRELGENNNRRARFRTVFALIINNEQHLFEGIVNGEITHQRSGVEGFGYDPIFRPDGYDKTFAELGSEIKNKISHRARATIKLCDYLMKIEH
jgi:XTP/dITP diphosphohydrolase